MKQGEAKLAAEVWIDAMAQKLDVEALVGKDKLLVSVQGEF